MKVETTSWELNIRVKLVILLQCNCWRNLSWSYSLFGLSYQIQLHAIFFYVFNKNWNSHSKSNVLMEWHEIQNIFSMLWTIHFLTLHKNYCTWNVVRNSSLTLLTLFLNFWEFENFICFYLLCYFNPETVGRQFSPSSSWFNPEHCLPHTYLKDLNQTSIPSFSSNFEKMLKLFSSFIVQQKHTLDIGCYVSVRKGLNSCSNSSLTLPTLFCILLSTPRLSQLISFGVNYF